MRLNDKWSVLLLTVVTFLLYACTIWWDFAVDDFGLIVNNEKIKSLNFIPTYFTTGMLSSISGACDIYYRPLYTVYLAVNYTLWGGEPYGFHLMNVVMQASITTLVYFLSKTFYDDDNLFPLLGALLFAVHPIHTESVSWIVGGTDLMLTFFILTSLMAYIHYHQRQHSVSLVTSAVLFICALLTKEVAIIFPMLIFGYDLLVKREIRFARWSLFIIISVCYLIIRRVVLGATLGGISVTLEGGVVLFKFLCKYLTMIFWPWPLNLYFFIQPHIGAIVILSALIIMMVLLFLSFRDRKRIFALLWFLFLVPPLFLAFLPPPLFAERYLYLPSVGFSLLISFILFDTCKLHPKKLVMVIVPIYILMGTMTVMRSMDWENDGKIISSVIRNRPTLAYPYTVLGNYYERKKRSAEAINVYVKSLENVKGAKELAIIYEVLGRVYGENSQFDNSISAFKKALSYEPDKVGSWVGLGNIFFIMKNYDQASYYYTRALTLDKYNYLACQNLVKLNEAFGYHDKAVLYANKCTGL